jgi:chaperonin GroES
MKIKPLYDRVLVKRIEEKEQKKGGIIIPDSAKEKPMEGKVIAVGAGRIEKDGKRIALEVKAGDRVLFGKYAGQEIKIDDVEHVILKEDEVLGIVK